MHIHTLTRRQFVPAPPGRVFGFFPRPENLAILTPPALIFHILTPSPIVMKPGAQINYTIRLFGVRVRWTTLITEFDSGRSFVDEVRYALPSGILGRLAHVLVVKRRLNQIFDYRAEAVAWTLQEEAEGIAS